MDLYKKHTLNPVTSNFTNDETMTKISIFHQVHKSIPRMPSHPLGVNQTRL